MKKIFWIAQKELSVYFRSSMAYIVLILTISVFNVFFYLLIDQGTEASLRDLFKVMEFMFLFFIPILCMKVFSEEKMNGTMEFLLTTPTRISQIVLGKYLGTFLFFSVLLGLSLIYYILLEMYSSPERLVVLLGYLALWLEGGFFIAIGVLTSSWTKNQIISAISSYVIIFMLYVSMFFIEDVNGPAGLLVRKVSVLSHTENLFAGLLHLSDIIYFLSGTVICLMLTMLHVKSRP